MNVCIGVPPAIIRVVTVPVAAVATEREVVLSHLIVPREQWTPGNLIHSVYVFTGRIKHGLVSRMIYGADGPFCLSHG